MIEVEDYASGIGVGKKEVALIPVYKYHDEECEIPKGLFTRTLKSWKPPCKCHPSIVPRATSPGATSVSEENVQGTL